MASYPINLWRQTLNLKHNKLSGKNEQELSNLMLSSLWFVRGHTRTYAHPPQHLSIPPLLCVVQSLLVQEMLLEQNHAPLLHLQQATNLLKQLDIKQSKFRKSILI